MTKRAIAVLLFLVAVSGACFGQASFANIKRGYGSPESSIYGVVGDIYMRQDGGASTTLYVKESGSGTNTGWVAFNGAGFSGQGTTTTVLHGNPTGSPAFGPIVNADITNATIDLTTKVTGPLPSANMAAAALVRTCEIVIGDPGAASPLLLDDNDQPAVCVNDTTQTMTITGVKCYADAGSPTVNPIVHGGSATSILTGALTCGTGSYASGTLNGTPTEAAGATLDGNITVAGGVGRYLVIRISRTL